MAQMNEKELNRALRTGLPSGVFLLYGSDRYLVERYASLIVDRAVKGDKTFNYERVDGARIDFDHLYDSILTLPMMAERRAVNQHAAYHRTLSTLSVCRGPGQVAPDSE